jgi:hypothetical protein
MSNTQNNIIRLVREHTGLTEAQATVTVGSASIIISTLGILSGIEYEWVPNDNAQTPMFSVYANVNNVDEDFFPSPRMYEASDGLLFEIYNAMVDLYNESIDS